MPTWAPENHIEVGAHNSIDFGVKNPQLPDVFQAIYRGHHNFIYNK